MNPRSWGDFATQVGLPAFFAIVFFVALGFLWWRQLKQPSNREQLAVIRWMYTDAVERNARLRKVLRAFCDVVVVFAVKAGVEADVKQKIERIQDVLDNGPPPTPEALKLSLNDNDS